MANFFKSLKTMPQPLNNRIKTLHARKVRGQNGSYRVTHLYICATMTQGIIIRVNFELTLIYVLWQINVSIKTDQLADNVSGKKNNIVNSPNKDRG